MRSTDDAERFLAALGMTTGQVRNDQGRARNDEWRAARRGVLYRTGGEPLGRGRAGCLRFGEEWRRGKVTRRELAAAVADVLDDLGGGDEESGSG